MKDFIVVSFYTSGFYEEIMNTYLLSSIKQFDLPYCIKKVNSKKSWSANTNLKPKFCLDIINEFPNKTIFWLDADCKIIKEPTLFYELANSDYDLGVYYLEWSKWFYYRKNKNNVFELVSNIIMFKNTPIVKKVFREWLLGAAEKPYIWEQKHLEKAVSKYKDELKLFVFPDGYSYMVKLPNGEPPKVNADPVILQYQISRKVKRDRVEL